MFHCIHRSELNGLVASANSDKVVRIWDTRIGGKFTVRILEWPCKLQMFYSDFTSSFSENSMVQTALTSHQGWVIAVQWSPIREHQLLSGSYDSSLKYGIMVTDLMCLISMHLLFSLFLECGILAVQNSLYLLLLHMKERFSA